MFKKRVNPQKKKDVNLCKKCKKVYTSEKDRICITCKSEAWLSVRPNNKNNR
jgi:hypothetical protein